MLTSHETWNCELFEQKQKLNKIISNNCCWELKTLLKYFPKIFVSQALLWEWWANGQQQQKIFPIFSWILEFSDFVVGGWVCAHWNKIFSIKSVLILWWAGNPGDLICVTMTCSHAADQTSTLHQLTLTGEWEKYFSSNTVHLISFREIIVQEFPLAFKVFQCWDVSYCCGEGWFLVQMLFLIFVWLMLAAATKTFSNQPIINNTQSIHCIFNDLPRLNSSISVTVLNSSQMQINDSVTCSNFSVNRKCIFKYFHQRSERVWSKCVKLNIKCWWQTTLVARLIKY